MWIGAISYLQAIVKNIILIFTAISIAISTIKSLRLS